MVNTIFFILLQPMKNRTNMKSGALLILVLLLACPLVFSQVPPAPQQPPPQLPVNGGLIALVLAGLFYGVKKSLKKK